MVQFAGGDLTRILEPGWLSDMGTPEWQLLELEGGTEAVHDERR